MKIGKKQIVGWIVSAGFLFLAFRNVHWHEFFQILGQVSVLGLLSMVGAYMIGFLFRGLRSLLLLPQLPFTQALGGVFVGYAANNLLPARLGEFVRAHVIAEAADIRRSTALSSVLIERIFDGTAIVCLLFVGSAALELPPWANQLRQFGVLLFSTAFLGIVVIGKLSSRISALLPNGRIAELIRGLLTGAELAVRTTPVIAGIIAISLVIWTIESGMFYLGFQTFGFDLSFRAALFVMAAVNLGVLIPSTPGGLGVFQYFAVASLSLFEVENAAASAYAIAIHLCQYLPVTVIGGIWLQRLGITPAQAAAETDEATPTAAR